MDEDTLQVMNLSPPLPSDCSCRLLSNLPTPTCSDFAFLSEDLSLVSTFVHDDCLKKIIQLKNYQNEILEQQFDFDSPSIHSKTAVDFYEKVLNANPTLLEWLHTGYLPEFKYTPPPYEERNNKSASDKPDIVDDIVWDWEREGKVERVDKEQLTCVNPLSLISKTTAEGQTKHRLCLDLSRNVNKATVDFKCKLDMISETILLLDNDAYMASFDLKSMYCQIRLHPSVCKYFGFKIKVGSEWQYFQYKVLPFGLAPAVFVANFFTRPIKAYLQQKGVNMSVYIDDTFTSNSCPVVCLYQTKFFKGKYEVHTSECTD